MLGGGRSYLGFFLRGCGLAARGGLQGTWLSLKKVTMKGCLERGPLRPTKPIQPADRERSGKQAFPMKTSRWELNTHGCLVESCCSVKVNHPRAAHTFLGLHVETYAEVAAGMQEPVVGGRGDVEGQPALLSCSHRLYVQQHQLRLSGPKDACF